MATTTKRSGGRKKAKATEVVEELPLSAEGASERELFQAVARGVYDVIADTPTDLSASVAVQINLEANGWTDMLVHWVREIVAAHQQRNYVFKKFVIHDISKHRLAAEAWGERLAPERLNRRAEIRGVPYHRMTVDRDDATGVWRAEMILEVVKGPEGVLRTSS
jgi:SHS2 domain-containing protein